MLRAGLALPIRCPSHLPSFTLSLSLMLSGALAEYHARLRASALSLCKDGNYWPIRPLATCTVWVALDRSDTGNGCLRVRRPFVPPVSHPHTRTVTRTRFIPHPSVPATLALDGVPACCFWGRPSRLVVAAAFPVRGPWL